MTITDGNHAKKQEQKLKGLHINTLNYVFIATLLLLSAMLFVLSSLQYSEYNEGSEITDEYHQIEKLSRMVESASDDLTRDVQYFVMTGRQRYLDDYFKEANVTKRRENAIEDLKSLKNTDTLVILLEESVEESMELMKLEYEAMRYAAEGYGLQISALPEEIRNTSLPGEADSMTAEEKIEKSRNLVFGSDYEAYKNRITGYVGQYLEKAITIMDDLQMQGRQDMSRLLLLQRIAIVIIVIMGFVLFFTISRLVVYPLKHAVHHMAGGERIFPLDGTYEIRYMSNAYNGFHSDSLAIQKQLKLDAERDELTGVLNRRGYRTVIDRLSLETFPMALLVMDIDNFKSINDTYGHSAGDAALQKVAHLLMNTFRSTDITSRIGGDEFTVILSDVTPANLETIRAKVDRLNEVLTSPESDSVPPLSISVGCAFSDSGYNEHLFNVADARMYDSKESGGKRIRFA